MLFPDEMWLKILMRCDMKTISKVACTTSKFNRLAYDQFLWKERILSGLDTGIHLPPESLVGVSELCFAGDYKAFTKSLITLTKNPARKRAIDILVDLSNSKKISVNFFKELIQQVSTSRLIGLLLVLNPVFSSVITKTEYIGFRVIFNKQLTETYYKDLEFIGIVQQKIPRIFNYIDDFWLKEIYTNEKLLDSFKQNCPEGLLNAYIRKNDFEAIESLLSLKLTKSVLNSGLKETARYCNLKLFYKLLEAGADPTSDAVEEAFYSLVEYILQRGQEEIKEAKPLIEKMSNLSPSILEIRLNRKRLGLEAEFEQMVDAIQNLLDEIAAEKLSPGKNIR